MSKTQKAVVNVRGSAVTILAYREEDYISLTDIARHRDPVRTDYLISNWLRNRNTIEFLGIWERLNNPGFNPIEFDGIKKSAGLNSFILTAKQWIEGTADYCQSNAVLAAFLRDALHRLTGARELTFASARDVCVRLLAHKEDGEFAVLWVPVIELERQAADLGGTMLNIGNYTIDSNRRR